MSTPSRAVVLLLADISGYTAYLAASEPERAPALAADLVETVVRQLRPTFRLEKLEGDAAFMVAPLDRLTGPALLDAIDATTAAFRTRLRSLAQSTTCDCEACRRIPELGLKFVVHAGDVVTQRVAGRTELAGVDAIIAHRLLKASTPTALGLERYALITDACVRRLGLETEALGLIKGAETFDYLGEVQIWMRDISAAFVDGDGVPDWVAPRRRPLLEVELRVPLAPMPLWERLTSPENRARVAFCAADRLAQVEEIVEWRPFASFTRRVKLPELPGDRRLTARYELEPDGDATKLRVRWWGSTVTSDHARREHDRLCALVT
jgi:class 3 adenylate cyclase